MSTRRTNAVDLKCRGDVPAVENRGARLSFEPTVPAINQIRRIDMAMSKCRAEATFSFKTDEALVSGPSLGLMNNARLNQRLGSSKSPILLLR